MFTNIINSFLNVRNKVRDMDGNWVDQIKPRETLKTSSALSANITTESERVIFEVWDREVVLESIEIGQNANDAYMVLHVEQGRENQNYSYELFHTVGAGSTRGFSSPANIESRGSYYLSVDYRNEATGAARVQLNSPIHLPNGGRLAIRSANNNVLVTYKVTWREIER